MVSSSSRGIYHTSQVWQKLLYKIIRKRNKTLNPNGTHHHMNLKFIQFIKRIANEPKSKRMLKNHIAKSGQFIEHIKLKNK